MKLNFKKIGEIGMPIIILHGLFGSSDNWLTLGNTLAEKFQVYLLDLRNHGLSPKSDDFNYSSMAADINEFLVDNKLDKVNLVGHSMGGKVAMQFADSYSKRLIKLVVVDIAPKFYPVHHSMILQGLNLIDLKTLQSRTQAIDILKNFEENESVRQFLVKNLFRNTNLGTFDWRINLPVITKEIANIGDEINFKIPFQNPTLFIKGENSPYIQAEDEEEILKMFPNTLFSTIPGAGHWVQAEKPKEFLEVLIKFLS
jgi:esterase